MSNEYTDVNASLRRFLVTSCQELALLGIPTTPLNLDAFANPTDWPPGDFLGLSEFMLNTDGRMIDGAAAIVVSTREDVNLDRMTRIVNLLLEKLLPGKSIPIYSTATTSVRGRISLIGTTRVGAVVNTESQPAQPIFIHFRSDQTFHG